MKYNKNTYTNPAELQSPRDRQNIYYTIAHTYTHTHSPTVVYDLVSFVQMWLCVVCEMW